MEAGECNSDCSADKPKPKSVEMLASSSPVPSQSVQNAVKQAMDAYRAQLLTISDPDVLRREAKKLMTEKRQLRLKQRNNSGIADVDPEVVKNMKRNLVELGSKEEMVQQRIDELSKIKTKQSQKVLRSGGSRSKIAPFESQENQSEATKEIAASWLANSLLKSGNTPGMAQDFNLAAGSSGGVEAPDVGHTHPSIQQEPPQPHEGSH